MGNPSGFEHWWSACLNKGTQLIVPVKMGYSNRLYQPELAGRWRARIDPVVLHSNYQAWIAGFLSFATTPLGYRQFRSQMLLVGCTPTQSRFMSHTPRPVLSFMALEEHRAAYPSLTR